MEDERTYLIRRAHEERVAAAGATHPNVRAYHLGFAAAYERRLGAVAAERRAEMHIVDA